MLRYLVLVLAVFLSVQVKASPQFVKSLHNIDEYRLNNGLTILLAPDESKQIIHLDLVYLSGSLSDPEALPGLAHFHEHMMFKGTQKRTKEELLQGLQERGIQFNASTSYDRVRYTATLSSNYQSLDYLLELEAERMAMPNFTESDLASELEVVRQEIAQSENDASTILFKKMMEAAWGNKLYGRSVIGEYEALRSVTPEDMQAFHRHYYRPDNAVLVLTGGFEKHRVLESIARHFAAIERPKASIPVVEYVPANEQGSTFEVHQGDYDILNISFELPPAKGERFASLALIGDLLAGEPHGRLYQSQVMEGMALTVYAAPMPFKWGGQFMMGAMPYPDQSRQTVQEDLLEQFTQLLTTPVSQQELERVQTNRQALIKAVFTEPASLSDMLAETVPFGDWEASMRLEEVIQNLTPEDLQRHYFSLFAGKQPIVGHLFPQQGGSSPALVMAPSQTELEVNDFEPEVDENTPVEPFDVAVLETKAQEVERTIQRDQLHNGMKVALRPMPDSKDLVRGRMNLRFGTLESMEGTQAVRDITSMLLIRGTQDHTYQEVVDKLNRLESSLEMTSQGSRLVVDFASPAQNLDELLELIAEVLKEPAFPEREFEFIKRQQVQLWQRPITHPSELAVNALLQYSQQDYSTYDPRRNLPPSDYLALLEPLTLEEVKNFYQSSYGAQYGEVALTGNFDPEHLKGTLNTLFGSWMSQSEYEPIVSSHQELEPVRKVIKGGETAGYYISRVNFPMSTQDSEYPAVQIMEDILGHNPLSSRLAHRIRQQEQLAYGVRSSLRVPYTGDQAYINVYGDFPIGQGGRYADTVKAEMDRLTRAGVSQRELDLAKNSLLSRRQKSIETEQGVVNLMARQLYYGTTTENWTRHNEKLVKVTLGDVKQAALKYLNSEQLVEIIVDPS
ncbi:M16 family metallopeptidase [Rhodanobacter aciditrophus]|uniref:M16 family metallopeptidase n=1 Tax=Rhodanobacter aciditrophus TaxID=1623218 RepID=A0ABW4B1T3_9GAMM